ncbi:alpha-amylase family glycosyl hydrolase [Jannaschia seohaensis]
MHPRSFRDCNGDEIGGIPAIILRFDHLADLERGLFWLSPVYTSPMRGNG